MVFVFASIVYHGKVESTPTIATKTNKQKNPSKAARTRFLHPAERESKRFSCLFQARWEFTAEGVGQHRHKR